MYGVNRTINAASSPVWLQCKMITSVFFCSWDFYRKKKLYNNIRNTFLMPASTVAANHCHNTPVFSRNDVVCMMVSCLLHEGTNNATIKPSPTMLILHSIHIFFCAYTCIPTPHEIHPHKITPISRPRVFPKHTNRAGPWLNTMMLGLGFGARGGRGDDRGAPKPCSEVTIFR